MPENINNLLIFKLLIHGDQPATFQLFNKRTGASLVLRQRLTREFIARLQRANRQGMNVAMMVNQGDGKGRRTENVVGINACFVDIDGGCTLDELMRGNVVPDIVVQSSPGKFHAYWRTDSMPLEVFSSVQKQLAGVYKGDPSVCDLPRVMRVPGLRNWKYEAPIYSKILHINRDAKPKPWQQIMIEMGLELPDVAARTAADALSRKGDHNVSIERVRQALQRVSPESRENWMKVGMALHSEYPGNDGRALWDDWSRSSSKYDAETQASTWTNFKPQKGIKLGTLFWMAGTSGKADGGEPRQPTELQLSELFASNFETELRFVDNKPYGWNGNRWQPDSNAADRRAREFVKGVAVVSAEGDLREKAFADKLQTRAAITSLIELAKGDSRLRVPKAAFDAKPELLSVANGVIDLTTQQFRAAEATDMLSRSATATYDENAQCPGWLTFIEQITDGDRGLARYLRTVVGYTLFGHANEQVFFVLIGSGANGKSLFLSTVLKLLGDYGLAVQSTLLQRTGGNANSPSPAMARIEGRRMLACSEMPKGKALDEAFVKQLSGSDAVSARGLYSDQVEFIPVAKLFLAVNSFPDVRFDDDAMWRRIVPIPFRRSFLGSEADPNLGEKLVAELPGILNWALLGVRDYLALGLWDCSACEVEVKRLRNSVDSVKGWLDAKCRVERDSSIAAGAAYTAYSEYMKEQSRKPVSTADFKVTLERRGFKSTKGRRHNSFQGFRLGG
jgi:putative DNA primase/helicase